MRSASRPRLTALAVGVLALALAATGCTNRPGPDADVVMVQLLSVTDFHSGNPLEPQRPGLVLRHADSSTETPGGSEYLKPHLDALRAANPNTVTFSNGDNFTAYNYPDRASNYEYGLDKYNRMGFEFTAVGNHDLDWNIDYLTKHYGPTPCTGVGTDDCFLDADGKLYGGVHGPSISANLRWADSGQLVYQPSVVRTFTGPGGAAVKVGIIGATVRAAALWPMSLNERVVVGDPLPEINAQAEALAAQGVQAIVVALHDGSTNTPDLVDRCGTVEGESTRIAREASPLVDAVVAGHTHKQFNCPVPDPSGQQRFHAVGGSYGNVINQLNLAIRTAGGEVDRSRSSNRLVPVTPTLPPSAELQAVAKHWEAFAATRANSVVVPATGPATIDPDDTGEHALGNLVADALVWSGGQQPGASADFALIDTFGTTSGDRATHTALAVVPRPDSPTGQVVRHRDAYAAYGHDSRLVTVSLTGSDVLAALEQQWQTTAAGERFVTLSVSNQVRVVTDPRRPPGQRVVSVTVQGQPLDPARRYRVALTAQDWREGSRHGMTVLARGTDPTSHLHIDNRTFVAYLRQLPTLTPPALDRVSRVG